VMIGRHIEVRGTVQGVGFRPWTVRLARGMDVRGRVWNDASGVTIEAFAPARELDDFIARLRSDSPANSRILELRSRLIPLQRVADFAIERSEDRGESDEGDESRKPSRNALSIPPDLATCPKCEAEVFDPGDRRYGYAFANCTECGPRFTIATDIPFDRDATTMASFPMCASCRDEYHDIEDRRFHAQPIACPSCGPTLKLIFAQGDGLPIADPLATAAASLEGGAILAIKGLGGFHLACDATRPASVRMLRKRKHRDEKPFAVMVRDLAAARALAELSEPEEMLLTSPERPIVLVRRRAEANLAAEVAPDTPLLGLLLPYTPLHHLLLAAVGRPLVMTSANVSNEPICSDNADALQRLDGIADGTLMHDRAIAMRCDDSVARVIDGVPILMRRSRGFVPKPFTLARPVTQPLLACGAHLHNTFCIAVDDTAYFGPHIGDLESVAAFDFFEEAVERMQTILSVRPEIVAHDLHPGYLSTRYAMSREGTTRVGVQHHHAHVVSALAEHGLEGPVLGVAFDGTGAGDDGASWGGEFLLCTPARFERLATFRSLRLPGGDKAIHEVWRTAYALLHDAFAGEPPVESLALFRDVAKQSLRMVSRMIECDLNAPRAHGVGRYFDAFGALTLNRPKSTYSGQVAMAWDFAADPAVTDAYPFSLDVSRAPLEVDLRATARAAVQDILSGVSPTRISARFHNTLIEATVEVVERLLGEVGRVPVALTGGVFQNERLVRGIRENLSSRIDLLRHREVPPGDGGLALGQALIVNAVLGEGG